MKLELEFDARTSLGILEALEAYTNPFRAPETVDAAAAFEYLTILRNAVRPYASEIRHGVNRTDADLQRLFEWPELAR